MILYTIRHKLRSGLVFVIATLAIHAAATPARAGLMINIDFAGGGLVSSSFGGAAAQPGVWNLNAGSTTMNLRDVNNILTGNVMTLSGFQTQNTTSGGGTDFGALMANGLNRGFNTMAPWSVSISMVPNGAYRVYVYDQLQSTFRPGDLTVEGVAVADFNGPSSATTFLLGQNYNFVDVNVLDGTLNLTQVSSASPAAGQGFGIAGLQITQSPVTAVPEPSTLVLWGLAFGIAGVQRLRRRTKP